MQNKRSSGEGIPNASYLTSAASPSSPRSVSLNSHASALPSARYSPRSSGPVISLHPHQQPPGRHTILPGPSSTRSRTARHSVAVDEHGSPRTHGFTSTSTSGYIMSRDTDDLQALGRDPRGFLGLTEEPEDTHDLSESGGGGRARGGQYGGSRNEPDRSNSLGLGLNTGMGSSSGGGAGGSEHGHGNRRGSRVSFNSLNIPSGSNQSSRGVPPHSPSSSISSSEYQGTHDFAQNARYSRRPSRPASERDRLLDPHPHNLPPVSNSGLQAKTMPPPSRYPGSSPSSSTRHSAHSVLRSISSSTNETVTKQGARRPSDTGTLASRRGNDVADLHDLRDVHNRVYAAEEARTSKTMPASGYGSILTTPGSIRSTLGGGRQSRKKGRLYDASNTGVLSPTIGRSNSPRPQVRLRPGNEEDDEFDRRRSETSGLLGTSIGDEFAFHPSSHQASSIRNYLGTTTCPNKSPSWTGRRTEFPHHDEFDSPAPRHRSRQPRGRKTRSGSGSAKSPNQFFKTIRKTVSAVGLGHPSTYDDVPETGGIRSSSTSLYDGFGPGAFGTVASNQEEPETEAAALNGVRVWYSSYDTIDWLHDQIKESNRVRRLRSFSRRSWKGWAQNAIDRSMGWVLSGTIGVLTALVAYCIIKLEGFLFDSKNGLCLTNIFVNENQCKDWEPWRTVFGTEESATAGGFGTIAWWTDFAMYTGIALSLAVIAATLTVYLTVSTQFETADEPYAMLSSNTQDSIKSTATVQPDKIRSPPCESNNPSKKVMYFAAGSGIPEIKTILSGFVIKGYLGVSTLFVKSFGLALSVASGMSLGKEGPMVHIACAIANIVSRSVSKYETNEAKKREMLSAACAAGVSVAFGAPLGGTLFSWEESSTYFPAKVMWRSFFCASVAALTLRALNPYGNGKIALLEVDYLRDYHSSYIYLVAIVIGLFGGIYGGFWNRLNIRWSRSVRSGTWLGKHPIFEVAIVSLVTTILSYPSKWTRMGGVQWVAALFADCEHPAKQHLCGTNPSQIIDVIREITQSLIVRAGLAVVTFGIRVPAGIFIPSLATGAAFGHIVGLFLQYLTIVYPTAVLLPEFEDIAPGVFALLGAAATLAGVTRTTISLVVIVIELTWDMHYVIPLSMSVLVAKMVADAIEKEGIYDSVINMNRFPYLDAKKEHIFGHATLSEAVDSTIPTLRVDHPVSVSLLQQKLIALIQMGHSDGCLPCLAPQDAENVASGSSSRPGHRHMRIQSNGTDTTSHPVVASYVDGDGMIPEEDLRVVGLLAVNELHHALSQLSHEPHAMCNLSPQAQPGLGHSPRLHSSMFSFGDHEFGGHHGGGFINPDGAFSGNGYGEDPYDLVPYLDQAPVTVFPHSPLELIQQLFLKLGARSIVVVDQRGRYHGMVMKKNWLKFLKQLDGE